MISTPATRRVAQNVLDYIHEYPERHDQSNFFGNDNGCGTTMCIAGTATHTELGWNHGIGKGNVELTAAELLGLENYAEREALFYEMDEERAVQKLKKIVVGEPWNEEDFMTNDGDDGEVELAENIYLAETLPEFVYVP